jgi:proteasome lid subunit RPN8/RPN11
MNFFRRAIIHRRLRPLKVRCSVAFWFQLQRQLRLRANGERESGAFLLGNSAHDVATLAEAVYYDDLDPQALRTGIVRFDGQYYARLWEICRRTGLDVVADVHTHPASAHQSQSDRSHPMMARSEHIALIVPDFASDWLAINRVRAYEYMGNRNWIPLRGPRLTPFLNVEIEGVKNA